MLLHQGILLLYTKQDVVAYSSLKGIPLAASLRRYTSLRSAEMLFAYSSPVIFHDSIVFPPKFVIVKKKIHQFSVQSTFTICKRGLRMN